MVKDQIVINLTSSSAEKFASLSPEKQNQLKLLLSLELQELINSSKSEESSELTRCDNAQNSSFTEKKLLANSLIDVNDRYIDNSCDKIMKKWDYLRKNHQELDPKNPLSDAEIELIRQVLIKHNQTRPVGVAKGELIIPDTFDSPFPEEILELFS